MSVSPTQRSIAFCKGNGWPYAIVEHFNPVVKVRVDLWGVGDMLVLDDEPGSLIVQACVGGSHATRRTKIEKTLAGHATDGMSKLTLANVAKKAEALTRWLEKGNRIEVWSWSKTGAKHKRKLWTLRRELITLEPKPEETDEDPRRRAPGKVSPF